LALQYRGIPVEVNNFGEYEAELDGVRQRFKGPNEFRHAVNRHMVERAKLAHVDLPVIYFMSRRGAKGKRDFEPGVRNGRVIGLTRMGSRRFMIEARPAVPSTGAGRHYPGTGPTGVVSTASDRFRLVMADTPENRERLTEFLYALEELRLAEKAMVGRVIEVRGKGQVGIAEYERMVEKLKLDYEASAKEGQ
jgi:hypothetical protein